jgi:hypothetical protein
VCAASDTLWTADVLAHSDWAIPRMIDDYHLDRPDRSTLRGSYPQQAAVTAATRFAHLAGGATLEHPRGVDILNRDLLSAAAHLDANQLAHRIAKICDAYGRFGYGGFAAGAAHPTNSQHLGTQALMVVAARADVAAALAENPNPAARAVAITGRLCRRTSERLLVEVAQEVHTRLRHPLVAAAFSLASLHPVLRRQTRNTARRLLEQASAPAQQHCPSWWTAREQQHALAYLEGRLEGSTPGQRWVRTFGWGDTLAERLAAILADFDRNIPEPHRLPRHGENDTARRQAHAWSDHNVKDRWARPPTQLAVALLAGCLGPVALDQLAATSDQGRWKPLRPLGADRPDFLQQIGERVRVLNTGRLADTCLHRLGPSPADWRQLLDASHTQRRLAMAATWPDTDDATSADPTPPLAAYRGALDDSYLALHLGDASREGALLDEAKLVPLLAGGRWLSGQLQGAEQWQTAIRLADTLTGAVTLRELVTLTWAVTG